MNPRRGLFVFLLLFAASLAAWENPVQVPTSGLIRQNYVRLNSGNTAYIAYSGDFKIRLVKFDGKKMTYIGQVSDGQRQAYSPVIRFSENNEVHIVWGEAPTLAAADNSIMYRRYSESAGWSPIVELSTYSIPKNHRKGPNHPKIEDLRFDIDRDNNLYIVFYDHPNLRCRLLARYGEEVLDETWPDPYHKRTQTPDIVVDETHVHCTWNQFLYTSDGSYSIYYSKRLLGKENVGKWSLPLDIKSGLQHDKSVHRPRITLDENNTPYILYMQDTTSGSARNMYIRYLTGASFGGFYDLTKDVTKTYNNTNLEMSDSRNILVVAHGAFNTFCNWRRNGAWSGLHMISSIPANQEIECASLSADGSLAVVTFAPIAVWGGVYYNQLWLTSSRDWQANDLPVPVIDMDGPEVFFGQNVAFDAGNSSDPDGRIVKYEWDFGDGDKAQGERVSHAFVKKYGALEVKLTVTDDEGAKAYATRAIDVKIQPPQPLISHQPEVVYFQDTVQFDGGGSADPFFDIVEYKWDFGDGTLATGRTVSHPYAARYGDMQVKLTVRNEKDVTASTVKTLKVNALFSANAVASKVKFRTLFLDRFGYEIRWTANAKNSQAGYAVSRYRVMRRAAGDLAYSQVAELPATAAMYRDLTILQTTDYAYAVCAVDDAGHVSPIENL